MDRQQDSDEQVHNPGLIADGNHYHDGGWVHDRVTNRGPGSRVVTYRSLATGEVVSTNNLVFVVQIPDSVRDRLHDNTEILEDRRARRGDHRHLGHGQLNLDALRPMPTIAAAVVFEGHSWVPSVGRGHPQASQFIALRRPWPDTQIRHRQSNGLVTNWLALAADDAYQYFRVATDLEPDIRAGDRITISDPRTTWTADALAVGWNSIRSAMLIRVPPPAEEPGRRFDHLQWQLSEVKLDASTRRPLLPPAGLRVPHDQLEVYHVVSQHDGRTIDRPDPSRILGQVARSTRPDAAFEVYYRFPHDLQYLGRTTNLTVALWAVAKVELAVRAKLNVDSEDLDLTPEEPELHPIAGQLINDPLRIPRPMQRPGPNRTSSIEPLQ